MAEFKDMLKYFREREHLSQKDLADKLGISASTISMYELGSRHPDFETEEAIADFFNTDLNTLRGKRLPEWKTFFDEVAQGKIEPAEIEHAIEMYNKYKNSMPKVQHMVDLLLLEDIESETSRSDS